MGRGADHSTRRLTDQQLALQNQILQSALTGRTQAQDLLMPQIQSLLTGPGYTPEQQSAITQQSMGAARSAYDALQQAAANRVARTNNSAGFGDLTAQLGREEGQTLADTARQNQIDFANRAFQQQLAGLGALGSAYGTDTSFLNAAMGVPVGLLNVRANANRSSGGGLFGGLLGGLGAGLSLFG